MTTANAVLFTPAPTESPTQYISRITAHLRDTRLPEPRCLGCAEVCDNAHTLSVVCGVCGH